MPLRISELVKSYDGHVVFDGFTIDFNDNEINCILGESGCGKTTLLNIIAGLEDFGEGSIEGINGSTFSYIFQEPRLLDWYNVRQNMEFVFERPVKPEYSRRIDKYLKVTGLWKFSGFHPPQLSGGMRQRLSIARAFAFPGAIMLMDEPFKGLDMKLKGELMDEFIRLWKEDGRTVLFVTHEAEEALMLADNIHVLGGNPIREVFRTGIKTPVGKRSSHEDEIVKIRKLLYSVLTGQGGEE
ncbi:MAG: ABC transporter ATP-binding protein [Clostridia bacterium]|nr:ABC transporter ATP-binding protein [Clostridia bacterium]